MSGSFIGLAEFNQRRKRRPLTEEECRAKTYYCEQCREWKFDQPKRVRINNLGILSGWKGCSLLCTDCDYQVGVDVKVVS